MQFDWLNFSLHIASIITGKANQQLHNSAPGVKKTEEKRDLWSLKHVCVSVCPCLHPPHTNRKWPKNTNLTFMHNAFLMQLWAAGPISFPHCEVKNICSSILVPCLVCTVLDIVRIITKHEFGLITVRWMWTPDTCHLSKHQLSCFPLQPVYCSGYFTVSLQGHVESTNLLERYKNTLFFSYYSAP